MSTSDPPSSFARLFQFSISGTLGFLVDATVLSGLSLLGMNLYGGRVVSFLCAVFVTWQFNRLRTFRERIRDGGQVQEALHYLLAVSFGGGVNYLGYVALLRYWGPAREWPLIAVAAGSLLGMVVNYSTSSLWVFRKRS